MRTWVVVASAVFAALIASTRPPAQQSTPVRRTSAGRAAPTSLTLMEPRGNFAVAPVAVFVDELVDDDTLAVRLYNFGNRAFEGMFLTLRYYDANDQLLKTHDWIASNDERFRCDPGQWCRFEIDTRSIPSGATRADGRVRKVSSVGPVLLAEAP